ncbi:hypothetical protein Q8W41_18750 [Vibrio splendidus]|uniref:hypothetical protein n=1 Tax=Vibrio splendidus TaxID=29497 RepID=UPI002733B8FE|nr:hypothetical protein [Vibrio splendidus]MDP2591537.1 hypothetical protein [Vibrio splendidus]
MITIDTFKKILYRDCIIDKNLTPPSTTNFNIQLIEDEEKGTLKSLTVTNILETDICITFDQEKGSKYSPLLRSPVKSEELTFNKKCDFIILRNIDRTWHVFFGEMKSTKPKILQVSNQIGASVLFFNYLSEIINNECQDSSLLKYKLFPICCFDATGKTPKLQKSGARVKNTIIQTKLKFLPVTLDAAGAGKISFDQIIDLCLLD